MAEETKDKAEQGFESRREEFLKRYKILTEELQVDFANFPMYMPDGQGSFKTVMQSTPVDLKDRPQPSPFMGH